MRHVFFVLALLCTALSAGLFYAFSTIVMPGLDLGGAASAIHSMQGMNTIVRVVTIRYLDRSGRRVPL